MCLHKNHQRRSFHRLAVRVKHGVKRFDLVYRLGGGKHASLVCRIHSDGIAHGVGRILGARLVDIVHHAGRITVLIDII